MCGALDLKGVEHVLLREPVFKLKKIKGLYKLGIVYFGREKT